MSCKLENVMKVDLNIQKYLMMCSSNVQMSYEYAHHIKGLSAVLLVFEILLVSFCKDFIHIIYLSTAKIKYFILHSHSNSLMPPT